MGEDAHVVIVTGATSGIGQAAAVRLAREGWQVVGVGRVEPAPAVRAALQEAGVDVVLEDLRDPTAPNGLVDGAVKAHGRLDAVVNSAGVHTLATATQTSDETWDEILAVNLTAAFRLVRAAIPAMTKTGGVVVNVASEAGLAAVPGQVAYNVSKAAMIMLTRSVAVDHAAEGIRAVAVCPGTTMTPLVRAAIDSAADPVAHEQQLAASRPAGRLGRPEEIAAAIAFVLGDDVGYLTGSELVIDGGFTAG
ncbi:SDR family NAD(P)-dependent oxidoreductase [Georgenia alba]|uniref:SDR family NAD(P)-dependent oxidoreductase n=1 Tax=Georgenia alba TaxID=2233858 RepID=A0ABW2Q958_9MICO